MAGLSRGSWLSWLPSWPHTHQEFSRGTRTKGSPLEASILGALSSWELQRGEGPLPWGLRVAEHQNPETLEAPS